MTYGDPFAALADPRRRAIFETLRRHPRTVTDIARTQPVSRPAVSQHLKVLAEAGLVSARPEGTRRIYGVRERGLRELRNWIDGFWENVLDRYAVEVARQTGGDHGATDKKDD